MRNYLTEFIGTFFLVLTVCLTVLSGSALAPLAIGSSLMIMVYMGGHISGGHFNPAVTLAVWLRGRLAAREVVPYWVAQVLGAVVAGLISHFVMGKPFVVAPAAGASTLQILLVEFLFAFALCLVVLQTATNPKTAGNSYYGLAIGFTVTVGAFAGGGISGGAFNPAVGSGPAIASVLMGGGTLAYIWLYVVGGLLGGAAAAGVYRLRRAAGRARPGAVLPGRHALTPRVRHADRQRPSPGIRPREAPSSPCCPGALGRPAPVRVGR